ncbi:T9SS type A sorting domain-containing protein [Chryseobacterium sp.]|jgi:hypothetical protein|uniref:T9SS type A sorting domain-containing protein n=1 Tax=Chryseobacterium sp. TaxID=1871047 RepID=UPI00283AF070|nr:T9SS type A sorting domain-containing protein [Chryseobacterium sp.]MDR3023035.1 T9SS type A sorting domain-containing protein [Chryseobacterium sp.]
MKNLLLYVFLLATILVKAQNDNCAGATSLTVGTSFASAAITTNNTSATTDGNLPSCNSDAVENVWFKVVVPASGNLSLETNEVAGSLFDDSVLTVYSGTCGSLTEIACDDDNGQNSFSQISLTGQTPGSTLYVSVWKYSSSIESGEFQISAYEQIPPSNNNCTDAIALPLGADFTSGAITTSNVAATTDGSAPTCNSDSAGNVWFKVIVPASGKLTVETGEVTGSLFDDSTITIYSGNCGSLTEIGCNDDNSQDHFSTVSLTGQTPGATLYISVWKYSSSTDSGEFKVSAYDNSLLSTHEVLNSKNTVTVFPNPFSDTISISDISKVKSVSVLDASGKTVKVIEKPSYHIYLNDLKSGLYFMTLKMTDGTVKTIKTIKK